MVARARCHVESSCLQTGGRGGGGKTREAAGGLGAVREEEAGRPGSGRQTEIDSN